MAKTEVSYKSVEEIFKEKAKLKSIGNQRAGGASYELTYDAFGESLEPIYYWILDFLRETLNYNVDKTADFFAAAEASGWYGEMGQRRTTLEKRAVELLGMINAVIKSVINLVYDMREFDLRLKYYDDLKSKDPVVHKSAEQSLKQIWLTEVDTKKGAAAINVLVQNLNFLALRDAFVAADIVWGKDREETKKKTLDLAKDIDVTEIVKRPLFARLGECVDWIYMSEKELRKRYNIEQAYLRSQISALKLYTKWARPYLVATQRIMPPEISELGREYEAAAGLSAAELASPFDIMHIYLELFGAKEVDTYGKLPKIKILKDEDKVFSCVEVRFGFRSTPGGQTERGHYTARGKAIVKFVPYVFTKKEMDELKGLQDREVLQFLDSITQESLDAMDEELKIYGAEKEEKKEEKKEHPLLRPITLTQEKIKKFREAFEKLGLKPPAKKQAWEVELLKAAAAKKSASDAFKVYETYKKAHKMLTWG